MSSVLFDEPGPRARVRHRLYNVLAGVAILAALGGIAWRMYDRGQFEYELWEVFVTPEYVQFIGEALLDTLAMAGLSILFAIFFGLFFGLGKLSDHALVRWPCWAVVEFFRAVPLLLLIVGIFMIWGIGDGFGAYWSVVIGLTLYNGAVLAEIFRAGVLAVPPGQGEAAYAIGMRKTQVMGIVLLPQAIKIMIPAIISQCVVALKDTSLGYYITAPGLTYAAKLLYGEFNNELPTILVISAIYIIVNLILTGIATWVQKRIVGEKKQLEVPGVGGQPDRTAV